MRRLHFLALGAACCFVLLNTKTARAEGPPASPGAENPPNYQAVAPASAQNQPPAQPPSAEPAAQAPAPTPVAAAQPVQPTATPMPEQQYVIVDPTSGTEGAVLLLPVAAPRPATLPYVEGAPIPQGYKVEEYHPKGLIISGAVTLGVLYVLGLTLADRSQNDSADTWLVVPVVGPFAWAAAKKDAPPCGSGVSSYSCGSSSDKRTEAVLDGLGQAAGAALLTAGLVVTRKRLALVDQDVMVAPYATSTGSGFSISGRF